MFHIIILVLIVFSISGFGAWYEGYSSDNNYFLLIDSSGSMLANDYEPNRLGAAKEAANNFIDSLKGDVQIGVISFSGTSFLNQPLTNNKGDTKNSIGDIQPISVGGTATGDAIVLAVNSFKVSDIGNRGRTIILLTDGQSNVGIDLEDAIDYASSNGVVVHTMGIGTQEGGVFNEEGAVSQLNPDVLENLASKTGGNFYLIHDASQMEQAYSDILIEKKARVFFDGRNYFLFMVFILLLIEWVLSNTKYKTII